MDSESVLVKEASGNSGRQPLEAGTQALFDEGLRLLDQGDVEKATDRLSAAHDQAPTSAQIRSAYGLALGRGQGSFEEARNLCESAAKQEFFNPDLYLNLAKVYLRHGRRSEALRYLRRGQMIAPGHEPIISTLASLGRRQLPIVPFLPRRHPVNRALGSARSVVMGAFTRA